MQAGALRCTCHPCGHHPLQALWLCCYFNGFRNASADAEILRRAEEKATILSGNVQDLIEFLHSR